MTEDYHSQSNLNSLLFNHLEQNYGASETPYSCSSISDLEFARLGILRCLSHAKTGHEFLQYHADQGGQNIDPSHFFKALKSKRRLGNISSLNGLLRTTMTNQLADPFAAFKELNSYDIYAADGHYHHAAAFDPKTNGKSAEATGHFFRLDLRNHHLGHLDLGVPNSGKKRAHDITVIRRASTELLRNQAPKGRKILYAWDKACIDYHLWSKLKYNSGIYFITREKSNSAAITCSHNLIDTTDLRNEGITEERYVGPSNSELIRRITYIDPRDGSKYTYITNDMKLPAYQLVIIYKHRWDVEKVFHKLKSKMEERKSWASTQTAKRHHAIFECLTHNLCLLMEEEMKSRGLSDEVEERKSKAREKTRKNRGGKLMQPASSFIGKAIPRASQRTVRFIRWLRAVIYQNIPLHQAIDKLARVWHLKIT